MTDKEEREALIDFRRRLDGVFALWACGDREAARATLDALTGGEMERMRDNVRQMWNLVESIRDENEAMREELQRLKEERNG